MSRPLIGDAPVLRGRLLERFRCHCCGRLCVPLCPDDDLSQYVNTHFRGSFRGDPSGSLEHLLNFANDLHRQEAKARSTECKDTDRLFKHYGY